MTIEGVARAMMAPVVRHPLLVQLLEQYYRGKVTEAALKMAEVPQGCELVGGETVRFPTSRTLDGSDAMNPDPDYSAAYVVLETDHPEGLAGHGLTFTIGRGTELCVAAVHLLADHVIGRNLEDIASDGSSGESA